MKKMIIIKNNLKFISRISMLVLLVTLLTPLTTACYLFPKTTKVTAPELLEPIKTEYALSEVEKGTIKKELNFTAHFLPVEYGEVYFKYSNMRVGEVLVNPGDWVKQGDLLVVADKTSIEKSIKSKEIAKRKAEIDLAKLKTSGASQFNIESSELDIKLIDYQLDDLRDSISRTELYAPISGRVVFSNTTLLKGSSFPVNKPIVRIANTANLILEYSMPTTVSSDISINTAMVVGKTVDVIVNSQHYEGEIILTPALANVKNDELNKNALRIKVNGLDQEVASGQPAQVSLLIIKKDDVLLLRKDLIRTFKKTSYVRTLKDGAITDKVIELGLENGTEVEVTKGLSEGDKIIISNK